MNQNKTSLEETLKIIKTKTINQIIDPLTFYELIIKKLEKDKDDKT